MEKINVKKTGKSKFGEYLQDAEGNFHSSTSQVNSFLSNQVPCEVEIVEKKDIDTRKNVISRVKVLSKTQVNPDENPENQFEQPVEHVKVTQDGLVPATNYKPSIPERISDIDRQKSIVAQSCIKSALRMIEVANQVLEEKITPTKGNVLSHAQMIKEVYDKLIEDKLPDY